MTPDANHLAALTDYELIAEIRDAFPEDAFGSDLSDLGDREPEHVIAAARKMYALYAGHCQPEPLAEDDYNAFGHGGLHLDGWARIPARPGPETPPLWPAENCFDLNSLGAAVADRRVGE